MCKASHEPGGPRRCSGDARTKVEHSTAAVSALESRRDALAGAVDEDGFPAGAKVSLTERAAARGLRLGDDGRPIPGGPDDEAQREREEVRRILHGLPTDADRSREGIERFAYRNGWATGYGMSPNGRTLWYRYRGEVDLPFYDRSDVLEIQWAGDEIIAGTITIEGQTQPLEVFHGGDNALLMAWVSRPGRPTSES